MSKWEEEVEEAPAEPAPRVKKRAPVEVCSVSDLFACFQVGDNERKPPLVVDTRRCGYSMARASARAHERVR